MGTVGPRPNQEVFKQLDKNNDGKIDKSEVASANASEFKEGERDLIEKMKAEATNKDFTAGDDFISAAELQSQYNKYVITTPSTGSTASTASTASTTTTSSTPTATGELDTSSPANTVTSLEAAADNGTPDGKLGRNDLTKIVNSPNLPQATRDEAQRLLNQFGDNSSDGSWITPESYKSNGTPTTGTTASTPTTGTPTTGTTASTPPPGKITDLEVAANKGEPDGKINIGDLGMINTPEAQEMMRNFDKYAKDGWITQESYDAAIANGSRSYTTKNYTDSNGIEHTVNTYTADTPVFSATAKAGYTLDQSRDPNTGQSYSTLRDADGNVVPFLDVEGGEMRGDSYGTPTGATATTVSTPSGSVGWTQKNYTLPDGSQAESWRSPETGETQVNIRDKDGNYVGYRQYDKDGNVTVDTLPEGYINVSLQDTPTTGTTSSTPTTGTPTTGTTSSTPSTATTASTATTSTNGLEGGPDYDGKFLNEELPSEGAAEDFLKFIDPSDFNPAGVSVDRKQIQQAKAEVETAYKNATSTEDAKAYQKSWNTLRMLDEQFDTLDTDKNGSINAKEIAKTANLNPGTYNGRVPNALGGDPVTFTEQGDLVYVMPGEDKNDPAKFITATKLGKTGPNGEAVFLTPAPDNKEIYVGKSDDVAKEDRIMYVDLALNDQVRQIYAGNEIAGTPDFDAASASAFAQAHKQDLLIAVGKNDGQALTAADWQALASTDPASAVYQALKTRFSDPRELAKANKLATFANGALAGPDAQIRKLEEAVVQVGGSKNVDGTIGKSDIGRLQGAAMLGGVDLNEMLGNDPALMDIVNNFDKYDSKDGKNQWINSGSLLMQQWGIL